MALIKTTVCYGKTSNNIWETGNEWLTIASKYASTTYVGRMTLTNDGSSSIYVDTVSIRILLNSKTGNEHKCYAFCTTDELNPETAIKNRSSYSCKQPTSGYVSTTFTFNGASNTKDAILIENIPVGRTISAEEELYVYIVPAAIGGETSSYGSILGLEWTNGGGSSTGIYSSNTSQYYLTVNYYVNGATTAKYKDVAVTDKSKPICTETYYKNSVYRDGFDNYNNSSHINVSRTGYHINYNQEWNTKADGTGTSVSMTPNKDGNPPENPTGADLAIKVGKNISSSNQTADLYANWVPNTLTVKYYSNKATACGQPANVTNPNVGANNNVRVAEEVRKYNDGIDSLYNYATLELTRTGYDNTGYWNTEADGSGYSVHEDDKYTGGQAFAEKFGTSITSSNQTVSIYAQWTPQRYTVSYDATGGKVNGKTTDSATATYDVNFTVASNVTRPGYQFLGWTTNSNGTPDGHGWAGGWSGDWKFIAGDYGIATDRTLKLYAMWKSLATMFVKTGTNTWSAGTPFVKTDKGWKRAIGVFVKTADGWKRSIR